MQASETLAPDEQILFDAGHPECVGSEDAVDGGNEYEISAERYVGRLARSVASY